MTDRRSPSGVSLKLDEPASPPGMDFLFAYGAMLPLVFGALAALALEPGPLAALARDLALYWGGAILLFFAGVRRGTSFRTMGGPTVSQILMMFVLFGSGLASTLLVAHGLPLAGGVLQFVCYAGLAVLDPIGANRGELPLYFRRLRPLQMSLAALSLAGLVLATLRGA